MAGIDGQGAAAGAHTGQADYAVGTSDIDGAKRERAVAGRLDHDVDRPDLIRQAVVKLAMVRADEWGADTRGDLPAVTAFPTAIHAYLQAIQAKPQRRERPDRTRAEHQRSAWGPDKPGLDAPNL